MHQPYLVDYWESAADADSQDNHKTMKRAVVYAVDGLEAAMRFLEQGVAYGSVTVHEPTLVVR